MYVQVDLQFHSLFSFILSVNMSEVNTLQNTLSRWLNRGNVISIWAVESQTMSHLIWSMGDMNGTFVSQPQGTQNTSSHFATLYHLVKKHKLKQQRFWNLKFTQKSTCILPPCPSIHSVMPSTLCGPSLACAPKSAAHAPVLTLPQSLPVSVLTRPPYCNMGAGRTRPVTSVMSLCTTMPNSFR